MEGRWGRLNSRELAQDLSDVSENWREEIEFLGKNYKGQGRALMLGNPYIYSLFRVPKLSSENRLVAGSDPGSVHLQLLRSALLGQSAENTWSSTLHPSPGFIPYADGWSVEERCS
jgi:hypothetical protein